MKCAYCGNTEKEWLWDEDDTFYCSLCSSRTLYENGELDLVECPDCHQLRDRKAFYCRHCNNTWE